MYNPALHGCRSAISDHSIISLHGHVRGLSCVLALHFVLSSLLPVDAISVDVVAAGIPETLFEFKPSCTAAAESLVPPQSFVCVLKASIPSLRRPGAGVTRAASPTG